MSSPPDKQFIEDENGFPVLFALPRETSHPLADPDGLPELVTPDATSGRAEWGRYQDAVREAARTFDRSHGGDIHNFVQARARNPENVDIPAFHEAVHRQRMADLVDIVDHHMRRGGSLERGHRMVRVQAPKGFVRRAIRQQSPEDLAHLRHRLHAIGHPHDHVDEYLSTRVAPDMWDQATAYEVHASEEEFQGLIFDAGDSQEWEDPFEEVMEMVQAIYEKMPPPVVNVYMNAGEQDEG